MKYIFVSSTFKDMQWERDAIQRKVLPLLKERAREFGEDVELCDLRWGIDTDGLSESNEMRKILSVCMQEIDNCKPYMLVLIGERYGTAPRPELLETTSRLSNFSSDSNSISITQLEIEYGALQSDRDIRRVLFMYREPIKNAPPELCGEKGDAERIAELKDKIKKRGGIYRDYTLEYDETSNTLIDRTGFVDTVVTQLTEIFSDEWRSAANKSLEQRNDETVRKLFEKKAKTFTGRHNLLQKCLDILQNKRRSLKISGSVGSGKNTLAAKIICTLQNDNWNICPFDYYHTSFTDGVYSMYRQWLFCVKRLLNEPLESNGNNTSNSEDSIEIIKAELEAALRKYSEKYDTPLLLVATDLPNCAAYYKHSDARAAFDALAPAAPPNVKCLFSYIDNYDYNRFKFFKSDDFCVKHSERLSTNLSVSPFRAAGCGVMK